MFCREQVARLIQQRSTFEEAGAKVLCIGNGQSHFAKAFQEDFDVTIPLFTNPSQSFYKALELRNEKRLLLKSKSLKNTARALKAGFKQGKSQGDVWQQGGVVVLDRKGEVVFLHRDDTPGDQLDFSLVLNALAKLKS